MLALCRMNWLREKLETGILETTVVIKWSDFSGKMIGAPGHGKEKILRGNVCLSFMIIKYVARKEEFLYLIL